MFYSNGKVLVHRYNNLDKLTEGIQRIEEYLYRENGMSATFVKDEERSYPCFLVPEGVEFKDLEAVLRPHLALKAIDEDIIVLPGTKEVDSKYYFDEQDKEKLASQMAADLLESDRLESEMKAVVKDYKAKIDELQNRIRENAGKHRSGYEIRYNNCVVKINFADGNRYFVDAKQPGTIHKTETLTSDDYQLRWDHERETALQMESAPQSEEEEAEHSDSPGQDDVM